MNAPVACLSPLAEHDAPRSANAPFALASSPVGPGGGGIRVEWAAVWADFETAQAVHDLATQACEGTEDNSPESKAADVAFRCLLIAIGKVMAATPPDPVVLMRKVSLYFSHTVNFTDEAEMFRLLHKVSWEKRAPAQIMQNMERLFGGPYHWTSGAELGMPLAGSAGPAPMSTEPAERRAQLSTPSTDTPSITALAMALAAANRAADEDEERIDEALTVAAHFLPPIPEGASDPRDPKTVLSRAELQRLDDIRAFRLPRTPGASLVEAVDHWREQCVAINRCYCPDSLDEASERSHAAAYEIAEQITVMQPTSLQEVADKLKAMVRLHDAGQDVMDSQPIRALIGDLERLACA